MSQELGTLLLSLAQPKGVFTIRFSGHWPTNHVDLAAFERRQIISELRRLTRAKRLRFFGGSRRITVRLAAPKADTQEQLMQDNVGTGTRRRPRPMERTSASGSRRRKQHPKKRPPYRQLG